MTTATKERPILFSAEMVRAILDGRKTQTRRVVTKRNSEIGSLPQRCWDTLDWATARSDGFPSKGWEYLKVGVYDDHEYIESAALEGTMHRVRSRIAPGDQLWVRETWKPIIGTDRAVYYRATDARPHDALDIPWRSPVTMPHWASRILLEVTAVRVERVQDISEVDACREGYPFNPLRDSENGPIDWLRELWDSINAKRGHSWESNPWVWVIEFRRVQP